MNVFFLGTNNSGNGNNGSANPSNPAANSNGPTAGNGNGSNVNSTSSAKIEINSMREALFSQDGWGGVSAQYFLNNMNAFPCPK